MSASARWILDGTAPSAWRAGRPWNACLRRAVPAAAGRFPPPQAAAAPAQPLCQRCRETRDDFSVARAALRYRDGGVARAAILLGKHGGHLGVLRHLARLLAEEAPALLPLGDWDALVPVPLHWSRRWRRGFNQAEVLARAVGRRHGLSVQRRLLRRVRATPPQHGDAGSRRRNVRDAFAVPSRRAVRRSPSAPDRRCLHDRGDGQRLRRGAALGGRRRRGRPHAGAGGVRRGDRISFDNRPRFH